MRSSETKKECPHVERGISRMCFNQRILLETAHLEVSLLERPTPLGIYSDNLDEFFCIHVAILNRIIEYVDKNIQKEQETATHTLKQMSKLHNRFYEQFEETFASIMEELKKENIYVIKGAEMTGDQKTFIISLYRNKLSSLTASLSLSGARPLNNQIDENIYLTIRLLRKDEIGKVKEKDYTVIELPIGEYGRLTQPPDSGGRAYPMPLDDITRYCLPLVFIDMKYMDREAYIFKFTKNAEVEIDNDLRADVFQKISKGVKSRKKGEPVRLVYDEQIPKDLLKRLIGQLNVDKNDTYVAGGRYHNFKGLTKLPVCDRYDLKYPVWEPVFKPELDGKKDLLTSVRQKDRSLHYLFHSLDTFTRVLREAAISKEVKSIKMIFYRLAKESKVIKALICAAKSGKKVTVVIELLVHFDEASNINQNRGMQDADVHVILGVRGLKIYSKLVHIGIRHGDIAYISVRNFYEGNVRVYTDYTIMIAHRPLVQEVSAVFDFIEKLYTPVNFKELLVSPSGIRRCLITLISKEIKNKKQGKKTYILTKINHVTGRALIGKLYEASAAGVQVELVVRGNCLLVTGIAGISESVHISDIIGRYLEYSRIFIFANNGEEKCHIGSADWMPRSPDNWIEVLAPMHDKEIQVDLKRIVRYGYRDTAKGRIMDGAGESRPWGNRPLTLCRDSTPALAEAETATVTPRSQEELYKKYKSTL